MSPDDLPIIGPMAYYPNVLINSGHGGNGSSYSLSCGKIIQEIIEDNPERYFSEHVYSKCSTRRCFI